MPRFSCPSCRLGQLKILEDTFQQRYPAWIDNLPFGEDSITYDQDGKEVFQVQHHDIIGSTHEELVFSCFLECDNPVCKETVVTSGRIKYEDDYLLEEDGAVYREITEFIYPTSFTPTVHLFQIPIKTPNSVKEEIMKSFDLFWISPPSSANSLRIALERLMDEYSISRNKKLHDRIVEFANINIELSNILKATKWIGNHGSHESDLTDTDVVLAYKFLQKCLEELYEAPKDNLEGLADKINIAKKPLSKINPIVH